MTPTRLTRLHAAATAALVLLLAAQSHAQTPAADWPYGSGFERRQSATARDGTVLPAPPPPTAPAPADQANASANTNANTHAQSKHPGAGPSGSGGGSGGGRGGGGRR